MAEHSAVNRRVVSSSLTCGANIYKGWVRLLNSQNHYSHLNSHHKQEINQKGCLIAALFSCFNYFQLKIEGFLSVAKMDAVIKQSLAFAKARRRLSFYHAASALSLHVGLAKQRHAEQIIAPRRGTGNFLISAQAKVL